MRERAAIFNARFLCLNLDDEKSGCPILRMLRSLEARPVCRLLLSQRRAQTARIPCRSYRVNKAKLGAHTLAGSAGDLSRSLYQSGSVPYPGQAQARRGFRALVTDVASVLAFGSAHCRTTSIENARGTIGAGQRPPAIKLIFRHIKLCPKFGVCGPMRASRHRSIAPLPPTLAAASSDGHAPHRRPRQSSPALTLSTRSFFICARHGAARRGAVRTASRPCRAAHTPAQSRWRRTSDAARLAAGSPNLRPA
ncbi:hypothetical protein BW21_3016 [Burkholderia humptydooensis]|nr:hypothetical protein BW21_3016 [Burkholderia sp. 2002721687]